MTDKEYESKKRELELKIKLLNIKQRQDYKKTEFVTFVVVACVVVVSVIISSLFLF